MNIEEIKEVLSSYEKLTDLAFAKLQTIQKINFQKYYTVNGVDNISIDESYVYVTYEEYQNSYKIFNFPTLWLTLSDEELEKIIQKEKEAKEFDEYQKLKAKFESVVVPNQVAIERAMRDIAFNKYDYSPRILTKDVDFKWSTAPLNGGKGETGVIQLKKGQLVSVKTQSGSLGDLKVVRVYNNDGSVNEYSKMDSNADFGTFLSIEDYQKK